MKKNIFLALALLVSISSFAQQADKRDFDYEETKHEFSLDLLPVIDGSIPVNLLYRKHSISKKGNNVGLRLGLHVGNTFSTNNTSDSQSQGTEMTSHNYYLTLGKERQIPIHKSIISYFGVDFGVGYSNSRTNSKIEDASFPVRKSSHDAVNLSSIGFLGFKYHISPNFSIGAETALSVFYSRSSITHTFESDGHMDTSKSTYDNLRLKMDHIRSIRFAYHF